MRGKSPIPLKSVDVNLVGKQCNGRFRRESPKEGLSTFETPAQRVTRCPTCLDIETGGWPLSSLQSAIAVFIIACPLGMGLSTPTALFVGGGLTEKHGILLKRGGEAFEEASRLDIAVFDKTGTLTQGGDPEVTDYPFSLLQESALNEQQLLSALKHLEANGSHPIGKAVVDFYQVTPATGTKAQHGVGKGIQGSFTVIHPTSATLDSWKGQAKSVVIVATIGISPAQTDI
ncbi:hypothetical protein LTS09_018046 [Friedmanniomyces endolithicus]|nr:hypothetical protein LTS09_018046 [Friedmanniomyces endolithicus]